MTLISVVMPAYNAEKYIAQSIDSLLNQTYQNFELIIINDGSTDRTKIIIDGYKDKRIVPIHQKNQGVSKSLNNGIKISKGDFICRIDSDDICLENRIERQLKEFNKDRELVLVSSNIIKIDKKNKIIGYTFFPSSDHEIKRVLLKKNIIVHPSVMIRKSALVSAGCYNEKIEKYFEDYALWLSLSKLGKFKIIKEPLIKYRIHSESLTVCMPNDIKLILEKYKNGHTLSQHDYDIISSSKPEKINLKKSQIVKSKVINTMCLHKSIAYLLSFIRDY